MNQFFLVKVKYTKQQDNGTFKRVTEPYLLAAYTFTDAEARIYDELGSLIKGEFIVQSIARYEVEDILSYDDADVWYKTTISYKDGESEDGGKVVKKVFLTSAHSVKEATERIVEGLATLMVDYKITGTIETSIIDIFPILPATDVVLTTVAQYPISE